jgi:hypothetical protein
MPLFVTLRAYVDICPVLLLTFGDYVLPTKPLGSDTAVNDVISTAVLLE